MSLVLSFGCRFDKAGPRFLEAHGEGQMRAIAASASGIDALGSSARVYHYPGPWGAPWREVDSIVGTSIASSRTALYVLDHQGFVWRYPPRGGKGLRWDESQSWQVNVVAVSEDDQPYVIAGGKAHRVREKAIQPLPCADEVVALAATGDIVYLVTREGALKVLEKEACTAVEAPRGVSSVAARGNQLAVAADGYAHRRRGKGWERLPRPVMHRATGSQVNRVADVSLSRNTLWVRDAAGFVYMLAEP